MNIFGYWVDLTFGPIATAVLLPVLAWYIKSLLSKADKLQDERHTTIVNKLTTYCEANRKEHDSIWERVDHHSHDDEGNVVIK